MKKSTIVLLSIVGLLVVALIWGISVRNSLIKKQEKVNMQFAQVDNAYKRRADLIPNLVQTVKGYAKHESSTLEAVVSARAKATQITVDPENLTPEKLQEYQASQGQLQSALGKLMMIQENYPDLKANQNFLELQSQLEGTENRIATERNRYNEIANTYNAAIRTFPNSLFGFDKKPYFEATENERETPQVSFE